MQTTETLSASATIAIATAGANTAIATAATAAPASAAARAATGFETSRLWHFRLARTALRASVSATSGRGFGRGDYRARLAWPAVRSAEAPRPSRPSRPACASILSCDNRHEAGARHAA